MGKGDRAEIAAREFLESQGLTTLATNFRRATGEIDLIMSHNETVVFIEVRLRSNPRFPGAAASVDRRKQRKLLLTAAGYLSQYPAMANRPCRFDVIAYDGEASGQKPPNWIQRAFEHSP